ncbi:MAG: serine/threonine-protein kinase [Candidatus Eisenbacteria bacterium]
MNLSELETLFHHVAEVAPAERARLLAELSSRDPKSAALLRRMLEAEDGPEGYVKWTLPPAGGPAGVATAPDDVGTGADGAATLPPGAAAQRTFRPGTVIAKRYRTEAFVAAGGMGEVYRVHDMELDATLALKTIRPDLASDPSFLTRLKQEVLLARAVKAPHVCRVFDFGRDETTGATFLTMEYLEGESLAELIRRRGRLHPELTRTLARQMAGALDAAHAAGIVHRDFKAQNVLLVPSKGSLRAVVTDFGLAVPVALDAPRTEDEAPLGAAGTPAYMAPEHIRTGVAGPSSDVYALGVVLYQMCTGSLPFHFDTPTETLRAHLERTPEPPSSLVALDPAWDAAILRALAKDPDDRFHTAGELADALLEPGAANRTGASAVDSGAPSSRGRGPLTLSAPTGRFFGRARELFALRRLEEPVESPRSLEEVAPEGGQDTPPRCVTLVGIAGIGKSRLARQYVWERRSIWAGRSAYVDFEAGETSGGAEDRVAVLQAALEAALDAGLGADEGTGRGAAFDAALGSDAGNDAHPLPTLVVLDGIDRLDADQRNAVLERTRRLGPLVLLATSREALGVPLEETILVGSLDPDTDAADMIEDRLTSAADASGVSPTGSGTSHTSGTGRRKRGQTNEIDRGHLVGIAERVAGIPRALELAAERMRLLSPEQLHRRLEGGLSVLRGPRRRGTAPSADPTSTWEEYVAEWQRNR